MKCSESAPSIMNAARAASIARLNVLSYKHENGKMPVMVIDGDPSKCVQLRTRYAFSEVETRDGWNTIVYHGVLMVWK